MNLKGSNFSVLSPWLTWHLTEVHIRPKQRWKPKVLLWRPPLCRALEVSGVACVHATLLSSSANLALTAGQTLSQGWEQLSEGSPAEMGFYRGKSTPAWKGRVWGRQPAPQFLYWFTPDCLFFNIYLRVAALKLSPTLVIISCVTQLCLEPLTYPAVLFTTVLAACCFQAGLCAPSPADNRLSWPHFQMSPSRDFLCILQKIDPNSPQTGQ